MFKRLKGVGVYFVKNFVKVITLLANTSFLPWEFMEQACGYIRKHAIESDMDIFAVNAVCNYWLQCLKAPIRFGER